MSRWRLIDSGSCGAYHNMALDEALAMEAEAPVLRLYEWSGPSVSIGCFQSADEIDRDYISDRGIPLVRRITGGRGILHCQELTYSFSAPVEGVFAGGLKRTYMLIGDAFASAFEALGLQPEASCHERPLRRARSPVCFESVSLGEIKLGGRKVIGSAQKRWPGRFMQQGSIPLAIDFKELSRVFPRGFVSDAETSMIGLLDVAPSLNKSVLKSAIVTAFGRVFGVGFRESEPTSREMAITDELEVKYRSPDWNFKRQKHGSAAVPQYL